MILREARDRDFEEVINFAKHNHSDHSYDNFKTHSSGGLTLGEYSDVYWTTVYTDKITPGPGAPPKRELAQVYNLATQRAKKLEKNKAKEDSGVSYKSSYSGSVEPKEDKTGLYNKYKSKDEIPDDLRASFEEDDDIEISNDNQSAKDIFDEMNAYVSSIMQKKSTKNHLIINGAPGIGKTTEIENHAKEYLLPGWKLVSESGTIGNSMTAMVPFFYKNSQNTVIILDDINTVFRTNYRDPVLNFLMALLDKKSATTKPVKVDKSQLSRYNKQLEESIEIQIDRNKLKEGILTIKADDKEIFNEHISLKESQELFHIIKPVEQTPKNKFGYLKEVSNKEFLDGIFEEEDFEDTNYSDFNDSNDEFFDPTSVPERFLFTSRIIMITNVKMTEINQAFRERCLVFFIELSVDQYIERLDTVMPYILKDDIDIEKDLLNWAKKYTYNALTNTLKAFKHDYAIPYKANGQSVSISVEVNRDLTFRLYEELVQKWIVFATKRLGNNINTKSRDELSNKLLKPFIILNVIPFLKASA